VVEPKKPSNDDSNLKECIRDTEERIRELEAAGADKAEVDRLRGELNALRSLPKEAQVFLQGSGSDGNVIIGFNLPEGTDTVPRDP